MTNDLARTPLYQWHVDHEARMVEFAGWSMPIQYTSITEEHTATRERVTLFDVSHMGRFRFDGAENIALLDSLLTRRVDNLASGRIRYSLVTNDDGGILDDVLVYNMPASAEFGEAHLGMVVNASNRPKLVSWFTEHLSNHQASFRDETLDTAMIAIQGPKAMAVAQQLAEVDLNSMKYFSGVHGKFGNTTALISRTGYTGEDGIEITIRADVAEQVWSELMAAGKQHDICAAGLAARDTLRLEAAMPLYGHELSENISPAQTGLTFALDLEGRQFPGRDAILKMMSNKSLPVRIGMKLSGKRVPREEYTICDPAGKPIGKVTSGTFSPTLGCPIAMGYVAPQFASPGERLAIDIRGRMQEAEVVPLPFYKRS